MKKVKEIMKAVRGKLENLMYSIGEFAENHCDIWYIICTGSAVLIDVVVVLLTRKNKWFGNKQKEWFRTIYGWKIE